MTFLIDIYVGVYFFNMTQNLICEDCIVYKDLLEVANVKAVLYFIIQG